MSLSRSGVLAVKDSAKACTPKKVNLNSNFPFQVCCPPSAEKAAFQVDHVFRYEYSYVSLARRAAGAQP